MELKFECTTCGQTIAADTSQIGMTAPCPGCGQSVTVPNPLKAAPADPASAPAPEDATRALREPRKTTAVVKEVSDVDFPKDKTGILQGGVVGVLGLFLVIAGVLLCFTLIGGILGVPMVLGGVALMVWGPALAIGKPETKTKTTYTGECPYCGHTVTFDGPLPGYDCPACHNRFVIRGKDFLEVTKST